ncbi:MAG TPA: sensor histidine kinase, partial [Chitinophagaceae bacterium]
MLRQYVNWKVALALVAILIVSGTIFYSQYLSRKIAKEERQKVEQWVEASNFLLNPNNNGDTRLPLKIIQDNDDVPIIWTNEKDSIIDHINLDAVKLKKDPSYLQKKLHQLKSANTPIVWVDPSDSTKINRYYYGHTSLLTEVQFYPIVQLMIVGLFIIITLMALASSYRSVQNQVWAGMAKETA